MIQKISRKRAGVRPRKVRRHRLQAFVIMPFSSAKPLRKGYKALKKDDLDTIYAMMVRALKARGYDVRRGESPTDILRDIVRALDLADLVLADVTGLNPNVMYELGIRHGFCKKTILISQDINELPFDIAGYHCISYGWITDAEKRKFRKDLFELLTRIEAHPDPRFGPVHTHIGAKQAGLANEQVGDYFDHIRDAPEQKAAVARYVVERFVKSRAALLLDAGTSVFFVAWAIAEAVRENRNRWRQVKVVTHSLPCWRVLSEITGTRSMDTRLIGGRFNSSLNAFFDPIDSCISNGAVL